MIFEDTDTEKTDWAAMHIIVNIKVRASVCQMGGDPTTEELNGGLHIYVKKDKIYVKSTLSFTEDLRVVTPAGVTVATFSVKSGQTVEVQADFSGMEPAYFPEQAYLDHPKWRGARCDQTRRSRSEYYAPCVENPEVRRMYVDAVAKLCTVCPFGQRALLERVPLPRQKRTRGLP